MGTNECSQPLPYLFEPKLITIKTGYDYTQDIFQNDIIIFNLNDSSLDEVEFVINGLDKIKYEKQKMLILISNIMTWGNTPLKEFTNEEINKIQLNGNEEEISENYKCNQDRFLNTNIEYYYQRLNQLVTYFYLKLLEYYLLTL